MFVKQGVKAWHAGTQLMMHHCRFSQHRAKYLQQALGSPIKLSLWGAGLTPRSSQLQWLACVCLRMSLPDEHTSQWGNCHLRVYPKDITNQTLALGDPRDQHLFLSLPTQCWDYKCMPPYLASFIGSGDLNSYSQACITSTFQVVVSADPKPFYI